MNANIALSRAQLVEAAEIAGQIETLNRQASELQERLNGILAGTVTVTSEGKRHLSPKARAKIAAGQVKRWKAYHEARAQAEMQGPPAPQQVAA
jgi:hypothetical protein